MVRVNLQTLTKGARRDVQTVLRSIKEEEDSNAEND